MIRTLINLFLLIFAVTQTSCQAPLPVSLYQDTVVSHNIDLHKYVYYSPLANDWYLAHNRSDTTLASHFVVGRSNDSTFIIQRQGIAMIENHNYCLAKPYVLDTLGEATNAQTPIGLYDQWLAYSTNPDKVELNLTNPVSMAVSQNGQNLVAPSEDFTVFGKWSRTNAVNVINDTLLSPYGCKEAAYMYVEGSASGIQRLDYNPGDPIVVPGENYTYSVWLKPKELDVVSISFDSPCFPAKWVTYNLNTQTKLGGSGEIESYPNGWYKVSVSCTAANDQIRLFINLGNFTPTGTQGIGIYGASVTSPEQDRYFKTTSLPIK